MMVRGPSTAMPASDGSPSDTRLTGFFSWRTRLLPLRPQIASPGSSVAPPRFGAAAASAGMVSFWMPSVTVLVAPGRPDASSKSFATGAFLFTLHDESTTIEAATALMARPGRQPPMSSSLLPLVPVRVTGPVSEQRLSGHLLSQEDLHRVGCRPLRMGDLGRTRGRTAVPFKEHPRDDARRLDDLL